MDLPQLTDPEAAVAVAARVRPLRLAVLEEGEKGAVVTKLHEDLERFELQ